MQRALDAGAVVVAEIADAADDVFEIVLRHLHVAERRLAAGEARLRLPAEVEHDLQQLVLIDALAQRPDDVRRQRLQHRVQVVGDQLLVGQRHLPLSPAIRSMPDKIVPEPAPTPAPLRFLSSIEPTR